MTRIVEEKEEQAKAEPEQKTSQKHLCNKAVFSIEFINAFAKKR